MRPARLVIPFLLALTAAAGAATFADGELYLVTNSYQSYGISVARIDADTGGNSLVVALPWPAGNPIRPIASYCRTRDRLVICQAITTGGLTFVDADGGWSQPFPTLATPYGVAARGDGIVYLFQTPDTFRYLDAQDVVHDLMDSTGTAPFQLGATGFWDELFYDPTSNSLFVANGDASGYADCADGTQSCFVKIPLSADGTRVTGTPVSVQRDISAGTAEDDVVGSGIGLGGLLAFTVDTNSNNQEPRMQLLNPNTMTMSTYASNGYYIGAASTCAGVYSSVRGQWVIRDFLNNVLRAYSLGQTGSGTVIASLGPGFSGSISRLVEIDRGDSSATAAPLVADGARLELAATPNPARGPVTVSFGVPAPGAARLTVHDVAGRLVRVLLADGRTGGQSSVSWDGRDSHGAMTPSGVYFVRLRAGRDEAVRRVVRVR